MSRRLFCFFSQLIFLASVSQALNILSYDLIKAEPFSFRVVFLFTVCARICKYSHWYVSALLNTWRKIHLSVSVVLVH